MKYTDGMHLIATSVVELHAFAIKLNVDEKQFVDSDHPHYSITKEESALAIKEGAKKIETEDLLELAKKTEK